MKIAQANPNGFWYERNTYCFVIQKKRASHPSTKMIRRDGDIEPYVWVFSEKQDIENDDSFHFLGEVNDRVCTIERS